MLILPALLSVFTVSNDGTRQFQAVLLELLWHYETEANYKRLAVLTFFYIRTETENGVRHRLLGIPL